MSGSGEQFFRLGRFAFQLRSADQDFAHAVGRMLPRMPSAPSGSAHVQTIDLDASFETADKQQLNLRSEGAAAAIGYIIDKALNFHEAVAWFDASILLDENEQLVLIAGPSHSGKTSLTLAMNISAGWKIVSEDMMLIDVSTRQLVPFPRPLGLRDGTLERVWVATGKSVEPDNLLDRWYFDAAAYHFAGVEAKFAAVVVLTSLNSEQPGELIAEEISAGECLRAVLPLSNLVRVPNMVNVLDRALQGACCCKLTGGDLKARVRWLDGQSNLTEPRL